MKKSSRILMLIAVFALFMMAASCASAEKHVHWATCLNPDRCGECGMPVQFTVDQLKHEFLTAHDNGDGTHSRVCDDCGYLAVPEEHTAICAEPGYCSACGIPVLIHDEEWVHDFYDRNNGDGTHTQVCDYCARIGISEPHYTACTAEKGACSGCGAAGDFEIWHVDIGNGVDNGDGTCSFACMQCGETFLDEHEFKNGVCTHCGAEENPQPVECAHDFYGKNNGNGTHTMVCDICGAIGTTEGHYTTCIAGQRACSGCGAWGNFVTWHSETCDAVDNGDGTCTFSCKQCGKTCTEKHYFINGVCDYCGAKDDTPVTSEAVILYGQLGTLTGSVFTPANGLFEFHNSLFLVDNGRVMTEVNGLAQGTGDWYYFAAGQVQTQYTGLVQYDGEWFYVTEGRMDTGRNGLFTYDYSKFLLAAGRIVYDYSGLFLNQGNILYNSDGRWYYIANGQVQTAYTGLAQHDGRWFYLVSGMLAEDYTGVVEYDGSQFNVVNGMVI